MPSILILSILQSLNIPIVVWNKFQLMNWCFWLTIWSVQVISWFVGDQHFNIGIQMQSKRCSFDVECSLVDWSLSLLRIYLYWALKNLIWSTISHYYSWFILWFHFHLLLLCFQCFSLWGIALYSHNHPLDYFVA